MKQKIWFWLCFVISVIFGIYFATKVILNSFFDNRCVVVRHLTITADTTNFDKRVIAAAAGIPGGTCARRVDLDAVAERIRAIPDVRDAAVRRMPNGNLKIHVRMYRAVAQWSDGTAYYPLSADGTIVQTPTAERTDGAVVFRGKLPDDISDITAAAGALGNDVDYLEYVENRRWDIYTTGGIRVMLPEDNPIAAIGTLATLNQNHNILGKKIRVLDMRDDARILVK